WLASMSPVGPAPTIRTSVSTDYSRRRVGRSSELRDDAVPELLEPGAEAVGVERRRRKRQPCHAHVLVAAHHVQVHRGPTGRALDLAGVPAEPGAFLAQDGEHLLELLRRVDPREEAVAVAGGTAGGEPRVPADDDRHPWLLHRLRVRLERRPAEELTRERLRLGLPEGAHGTPRFPRPRGPVPEPGAKRLATLPPP